MDEPDGEARCRRCGVCCHEKVAIGNLVVITDVPCPFLDTETNLCTVYPERFARQPHCASAARAATMGALPADCPYVEGLPNYKAPVRLAERPEFREMMPEALRGKPKGK